MLTLADLLDTSKHSPEQRRATQLAHNDYQLIADLIEQRRAAGMTQQDVATLLGITQPAVAKFERYDSDPKLSTVRRYAHAIGAIVSHDVRADTEAPAISMGVEFNVSYPIKGAPKATYAVNEKRLDFALAA